MRIVLVALAVLLVACTASAAPIPTATPTVNERDMEGCVTLIVKALDNGGRWQGNPFLEDACDGFRTPLFPRSP